MNDTYFELRPKEGFGLVDFGESESQILEHYGQPDRRECLGGRGELGLGFSLVYENLGVDFSVSASEVYFESRRSSKQPAMVLVTSRNNYTNIGGDYLFKLAERSLVENCNLFRGKRGHTVSGDDGMISTEFVELGLTLHFLKDKLFAVSLEMPFVGQ